MSRAVVSNLWFLNCGEITTPGMPWQLVALLFLNIFLIFIYFTLIIIQSEVNHLWAENLAPFPDCMEIGQHLHLGSWEGTVSLLGGHHFTLQAIKRLEVTLRSYAHIHMTALFSVIGFPFKCIGLLLYLYTPPIWIHHIITIKDRITIKHSISFTKNDNTGSHLWQ